MGLFIAALVLIVRKTAALLIVPPVALEGFGLQAVVADRVTVGERVTVTGGCVWSP